MPWWTPGSTPRISSQQAPKPLVRAELPRSLTRDTMSPTTGQRVSAITALVLLFAVLILVVYIVVEDFPSNLVVLGCIAVALTAAWYGLLRRGAARLLGLILALVALAAAVV